MSKGPNPIHLNPAHAGLLHKDLGKPAKAKLTEADINKAIHSDDPAERKRGVFAENARHWAGK